MKYSLTLVAVFAIAVVMYVAVQPAPKADASVVTGSEYYATTTAQAVLFGNTITAGKTLKNGYGALGSVVITGANTGVMNFYDATTTDVNMRTGNRATSTILIASIPASAPANTYVFDATVNNGLLLDLPSGNMPTTTITYR